MSDWIEMGKMIRPPYVPVDTKVKVWCGIIDNSPRCEGIVMGFEYCFDSCYDTNGYNKINVKITKICDSFDSEKWTPNWKKRIKLHQCTNFVIGQVEPIEKM